MAEWLNVVAHEFKDNQRRALAGLYNTVEGCDLSELKCLGLKEMLQSLTTPLRSWPNRVHLRSHFHRAALAVSSGGPCFGPAPLSVENARMLCTRVHQGES